MLNEHVCISKRDSLQRVTPIIEWLEFDQPVKVGKELDFYWDIYVKNQSRKGIELKDRASKPALK